MALSPEAKFSNFVKSIRKYFVDNLETTESWKLFFDWISDVPKDANGDKLSKWAIIDIGDFDPGNLASCLVEIILFTRNDNESDEINTLTDTLMDYIIDEDSTNGLKAIPLYNAVDWTTIGGITPLIRNINGDEPAKDNTKMKSIVLMCKWGSK